MGWGSWEQVTPEPSRATTARVWASCTRKGHWVCDRDLDFFNVCSQVRKVH